MNIYIIRQIDRLRNKLFSLSANKLQLRSSHSPPSPQAILPTLLKSASRLLSFLFLPSLSLSPSSLPSFLPSATAADRRSLPPPPEEPGLPGKPGEGFLLLLPLLSPLLLQPAAIYHFVSYFSMYAPPPSTNLYTTQFTG